MILREKLLLSPLYDWFGKRSYAQSGEDLIAWGELLGKVSQPCLPAGRCHSATGPAGPGLADWGPLRPGPRGFYVDVGAFHPKLFSNTYLFYKKGWRGICIEPRPEAREWFLKARSRDKFVGLGVGAKKDVLEYFEFDDGAVNTFSKEQMEKNIKEAGRKLVRTVNVAVAPLRDILASCRLEGVEIDLMSVDVEGMDLEVLESNDWKKFRPKLVICEDLEFDFNLPPAPSLTRGGVFGYLTKLGYRLVAKTPYSLILKDRSI